MIAQVQLELKDIFEDCQKFFEEDKPEFLRLLEQHIDLEALMGGSPFSRHGFGHLS